MLVISLVVNVLVLVPVSTGLLRDSGWVREVFGVRTPARGILTALYLAILSASAVLLGVSLLGGDGLVGPAAGLLTVQVVYKLLSPLLVGSWKHPVVLSNLVIAVLHCVTLIVIAPSVVSA